MCDLTQQWWLRVVLCRCSGKVQLSLVRSRLVEPLRLGDGKVEAGLYAASAQLLIVALTCHPSLVDLLLFPSSLSDAEPEAAPVGSPGVGCPSNYLTFYNVMMCCTLAARLRSDSKFLLAA